MKKQRLKVFIVVAVLMSFAVSVAAEQERTVPKDESLRRGEARDTLDPSLFKEARVKKAYQVAKQIPWVLDSTYCYCHCEESFQHKSVLSCYVDNHAAM